MPLLAALILVAPAALLSFTPDASQAAHGGPHTGQLLLGVYGVHGVPVAQQDLGPGPLYGIKARLGFPLLAFEAFYGSFREGDVTFHVHGRPQTIAGGTQVFYGGNLVLGAPRRPGVRPYLTGGAGAYRLILPDTPDQLRPGYNAGLGIEFRSRAGLSIDLSGRLNAVQLAGGSARKFAALQAGINLYLFG